MTRLEKRYHNLVSDKPGWSTYIAYANAVMGCRADPTLIHQLFDKLVDKEDYSKGDRYDIYTHLETLSRMGVSGSPLG